MPCRINALASRQEGPAAAGAETGRHRYRSELLLCRHRRRLPQEMSRLEWASHFRWRRFASPRDPRRCDRLVRREGQTARRNLHQQDAVPAARLVAAQRRGTERLPALRRGDCCWRRQPSARHNAVPEHQTGNCAGRRVVSAACRHISRA